VKTLPNKEGNAKTSGKGYAYTPGLKAKREMTVSKVRQLPIAGEVRVNVGDKVSYDTIVARTEVPGDPEIFNGALRMGVEPVDFSRYVVKKVGDRILKGEVIASYKALFGLVKRQLTSPVEGIIESISEITGQVIIRKPPVPIEVNAYISGKVVNVLPREGAVIETNAAIIQGIFGIGGETHGRIRMATGSPDEEMTAGHIKSDDKGSVLVGGSLMTLETLRKGAEAGVSCIVAGGIMHEDIATLLGEEIGVAITGQEDVGLTIIITEGFGKMNMSQRTFDLLKSFEGYTASVNGATQIRAGVLRPEIIIPHEKSLQHVSGDEMAAGIVPGTAVRIIRQPYFGAIGEVVGLPIELQKLESESYVRVLTVKLKEGKVSTVPRANVEIIEE
jgi:hypothetical protein